MIITHPGLFPPAPTKLSHETQPGASLSSPESDTSTSVLERLDVRWPISPFAYNLTSLSPLPARELYALGRTIVKDGPIGMHLPSGTVLEELAQVAPTTDTSDQEDGQGDVRLEVVRLMQIPGKNVGEATTSFGQGAALACFWERSTTISKDRDERGEIESQGGGGWVVVTEKDCLEVV